MFFDFVLKKSSDYKTVVMIKMLSLGIYKFLFFFLLENVYPIFCLLIDIKEYDTFLDRKPNGKYNKMI